MIKNTEYTITYTAWDKTDGSVVTGDVANHTCKISANGATLTTCTNTPEEVGSGVYKIVLTAAETNADTLTLVVTSSTTGVIIPPIQMAFEEPTEITAMEENIAAIKAVMPESGTVSTLTADEVWKYRSLVVSSEEAWGKLYYLHSHVCSSESTGQPLLVTRIWDAETRTLTSTSSDVTPQAIWEYSNRTLTSTIPTVAQIQSGLATASALATVDTVVDAIKAKTDNLPTNPAAVSDVQITVNSDGINVPTAAQNAAAVWSASSRTLTSATGGGGATAQEIWNYANRTLTSSQSVDMTSIQETLNAIFALLGCWNVSENVLTTYDENGNVLHTYSLTRDSEGNITRVTG
ncbi:MAG: hypothetical protein Q4E67_00610 [Planctomycetia bacterium]|nr:hypothetical protein [Planctomycetia bacterium]